MRGSKFSPTEIKEILSKPFEIWPQCRCEHFCKPNNYKRAPYSDQIKVFNIPHSHGMDIVLAYGGTRGGKSICAVAKGCEYAFKYPGCTLLVGADTREILKRTAMKDWCKLLTISEPWDHPLVYKKPNDHSKNLILRIPTTDSNGKQIFKLTNVWFLHFSDFKELRGTGVSFVHIEEASLIKDAGALKELIRRCDETLAPQRMIIISTNPEESKGWIHDEFNMEQFEPDYDGDPQPIGTLCNCHLCQTCLNQKKGEFEWVNGSCPNCKMAKPYSCPGKVDFKRVVFFDASNNPHVPPDYFQTNTATVSEIERQLYLEGKVVELDQARVYESFDRKKNVDLSNVTTLDPEKEMVWSFDFNNARQCSVICQERGLGNEVVVDVIDEIVIPPVPGQPNKIKVHPYEVGKEFLFRYPTYDQLITLHGDPAALNDKIGDNDTTQFQMIYDVITDPQSHMTIEEYDRFLSLGGVPKRVKAMPQKIKGDTKIMVKTKVDSTNVKLVDGQGNPGIFINPKCKWLLTSLEDLKWSDSNKTAIDVTVDKADRKAKDKTKVRLVSHITDALGYYIARKWPVVDKPNNSYVVTPGVSTVELVNGEIVESSYISKEEEEKLNNAILKAKLAAMDAKKGSLLEVLHGTDFFDNSPGAFDYFDF